MWTKSGIESEGQYSVTQEISQIFRTIVCHKNLAKKYQDLTTKNLKFVILNLDSLPLDEVDFWLGCLPGSDFDGLRVGQKVTNKDKEILTIVGFSQDYFSQQDASKKNPADFTKIRVNFNYRKTTKALCLYEQGEMFEVIERDIRELIPIQEKCENFTFLDDPDIQEAIASQIMSEIDESKMSYQERIKNQTIKNFLLKYFLMQVQVRGQEQLDHFDQSNLLTPLIQSIFKKSSSPLLNQKPDQLPLEWLNILGYQLRQKALETNEALDENKGLSVLIQDNKYIAFKGFNNGSNDIISFPIAGSINIQYNMNQSQMKGVYSRDIVSLKDHGILEVSIIETKLFDQDPQKAFTIINNSNITVVSEEIHMIELFRQMRLLSMKFPKAFDGLPEKIVVQIEKEDYDQLFDPKIGQAFKKPKFSQDSSTLDMLCELLQDVGNCSEELIQYMANCKAGDDMVKIQQTLFQALKSQNLSELIAKQKLDNDETHKSDDALTKFENSSTFKFEPLDQQINTFKQKNFDIKSNTQTQKYIETLIEKNIVPTNDIERNMKSFENQDLLGQVLKIVEKSEGELLLKEYEQTVRTQNLFLNREILLYILEHGDFEKLIPTLLSSNENKLSLANFLKLMYNESYKSDNQQSKKILKLSKQLMKKICQQAQKDEDVSIFLQQFYISHVIQGGFQACLTITPGARGKSIVQSVFYNQEEQAIKFSTPQLFLKLTKYIMRYKPSLLHTKINDLSPLPDILSLLQLYAIIFTENSTKTALQFYQMTLAIVLYTLDNQKQVDLEVLEDFVNNQLLIDQAESLNLKTKIEAVNKYQKQICEIFNASQDLRQQVVQRKQRLRNDMKLTRFLLFVRRTMKIIEESQKGNFDYLKYREFQKGCDNNFKDLLTSDFNTSHPMFDLPFTGYKQIEGCSSLKIGVLAKSKLPKFSEFKITTDPEGKNVLFKMSTEELVEKTTLQIFRNDFYIHYPVISKKLIAFGEQKDGKLGNNKTEGQASPTLINLDFPAESIKQIWSCKNFTVIQTENDKIYVSSKEVDPAKSKTNFQDKGEHLPKDSKIDLVAVGKHSILVKTIDNKYFQMGKSKEGHLLEANAITKQLTAMDNNLEIIKKEKVIQIISGSHFSLFLTEDGKLFGRGNSFLKVIRIDGEKKAKQIPLPERYSVKRIFVNQGNSRQEAVVILEVQDKEDKIKKYLSAGKSKNGLLGQGQGVTESEEFKEMLMQFQILSFTHIEMYKSQAFAISKDNQLYVWGINHNGILGLENKDNEILYSPTYHPFFKNQVVQKITVGQFHSLVQTSKRSHTKLYSIGRPEVNEHFEHLGILQQDLVQKPQQNIWEIEQFKNKVIDKFFVGKNSTFLILQPDNIEQSMKHQITDRINEEGVLHFYYDEKGKLVKIPPSKYEEYKYSLPDICFAIKYPIKDLEQKEFPIDLAVLSNYLSGSTDFAYHQGIQCKIFKEDIIGPRYYSKCQVGEDIEVQNFSEQAFTLPKQCDIHPLIFLRFARPIDQSIDLPILDVSKYYDLSTSYGLNFEIKPDLKDESNKLLIQFNKNLYDNIQKLWTKFDKNNINLIKEFIGSQAIVDDSLKEAFEKLETFRVKYEALDVKSDDVVQEFVNPKFIPLLELTKEHYTLICQVLQRQSKHYQKFMKLCSSQPKAIDVIKKYGWIRFIDFIKNDMMIHVKRKIINKKISELKQTGEGSVSIKRRKAFYFNNSGKVDNEGMYTIFGQIYQQIKAEKFDVFKKNSVDTKVFNVTFAGEGSQDAGGPFRDCITNICKELQSESLPILIRTANNKNNHGQLRECWIPHPSSKSPSHFKLFEYFGAMIGWAIRTTSALELDIATLFWKKIIDAPCDEHDLKLIDTFSWQVIEDLRNYKQALSKEDFNASVDQYFSTLLSDGSEVELCFKGKEKNVTWDNVDEFIQLVIKTRLEEFDEQMSHIKKGLKLIMPDDILFFMTYQELELRATGAKTCDPATLKKITKLDGFKEDSETVKWFWEIFGELTDEQRSLYLKFVWGRSRLPMNLDQISRKHTLEYYKSRSKDSLPISHTCFFRIDFPDYSSKDIFKQRLVYAITFCGDIDADRGRHDIADEE